jgi:putative toxin-antitoxin system antitoxin component (TIGR02293 family)
MESPSNDINEMLAKVQTRAEAVLGKEHFESWLQTPKRTLGNKIPLELAKTKQGSEQVLNLLGRIEHGVFS